MPTVISQRLRRWIYCFSTLSRSPGCARAAELQQEMESLSRLSKLAVVVWRFPLEFKLGRPPAGSIPQVADSGLKCFHCMLLHCDSSLEAALSRSIVGNCFKQSSCRNTCLSRQYHDKRQLQVLRNRWFLKFMCWVH